MAKDEEVIACAAAAILFLNKVVHDEKADMRLRVDAAICLASNAALPSNETELEEVKRYNDEIDKKNDEEHIQWLKECAEIDAFNAKVDKENKREH